MATDSATAAHAIKSAFVAAASTLLPEGTLVTFGHPGPQVKNYQDAVSFARVEVGQQVAAFGGTRPREETVTLTVVVSCYRPGGPEVEEEASAAAYGLLRDLEHYVRQTDTTLGGTCRHCFLVSHFSEGETRPDLIVNGRTIEIEAMFEAKVRVTGP